MEEWHHITSIMTPGGQAVLYLDGGLKSASPADQQPGTMPSQWNELHIGRSSTSINAADFFEGLIDEIMIFYDVKSPEQIRSLL